MSLYTNITSTPAASCCRHQTMQSVRKRGPLINADGAASHCNHRVILYIVALLRICLKLSTRMFSIVKIELGWVFTAVQQMENDLNRHFPCDSCKNGMILGIACCNLRTTQSTARKTRAPNTKFIIFNSNSSFLQHNSYF